MSNDIIERDVLTNTIGRGTPNMTEPDHPMPKPLTTFLPNSPEAKKLARWTYNYDHIKEKKNFAATL